jgi:hypothetical protein
MDFEIRDDGSIILLRPLTDAARIWVDENIGRNNGYQPMYPTVIVEPRYLGPILQGLQAEGYEVGE